MDLFSLVAPLLAPLIEQGWAAAAAALAAAVPLAREWLMASRGRRIGMAVARAAGQAFVEIVRTEKWEDDIDRLIDQGTDYVLSALPDTIKRAGVSRAIVSAMVKGEVGKLLAAGAAPRTLTVGESVLGTIGQFDFNQAVKP